MIEYVRKNPDGTVGWGDDGCEFSSQESLHGWLTRWAQKSLSTVEGRIFAVKRQFSLRSRVPLFLNGGLLLMPIISLRSPQTLLLNFHAIREWRVLCSGRIEVFFLSGSRLVTDGPTTFRKLMKVSRSITDFWHSSSVG